MATEVSSKIYDYFSSLYGKESADKYLQFIDEYPALYIRVNNAKISCDDLSEQLNKKYGIRCSSVTNFNSALKIEEGKERIGKTLEQVLGYYYIQSLSSMMPPLVLNPTGEDVVLDLCGAPGSKSTQIAELMNNNGTLLVNEVDNERLKSLIFNIERMSVSNAAVIHSKGEMLSKIYEDRFTKILVDAPCSGLGIIQKKGEVNNWWSLEHVERLQHLQTRLLIAAIKMAKVGGEIVYSTCTMSVEENELVIDKILEKYPVELQEINLPVSTRSGFTEFEGRQLNPELKKAIRILPWEINSDGFFLAKMIKIDETESPEKVAARTTDIKIVRSHQKDIRAILDYVSEHFGIERNILDDYKYIIRGTDIYFINKDWDDDNIGLFTRIGLKFGSLDKKERINFNSQAAQVLEKHITKFIYELKDEHEVSSYLTGGKIKELEIPNGQYVIKHNNYILGTAVKNDEGLKSRFPKSKRIQNFSY